jgi:hypothetical protein
MRAPRTDGVRARRSRAGVQRPGASSVRISGVLVSVCLTGPSALLPALEARVRAAVGDIPGADIVQSGRKERTGAGGAVSCCRLDVRCRHAHAPVYRNARSAVAASGVGGGSVGAVRLIELGDYLSAG